MRLPAEGKAIRVIGFDDAPFARKRGISVRVAGVVCANTRFEGLVWTTVRQSGWNATKVLSSVLRGSKYLPQLHAVLLDGIALGGFNVIDLPALSENVGRPCIAVMRKMPDLDAVHRAMQNLPRPAVRWQTLQRAGAIHHRAPFYFQCAGTSVEEALRVLRSTTDVGHVPEPLRLAHHIGSAVMYGESGRRA